MATSMTSSNGLPQGSAYLTRDCIHFRTVKSPVAALAASFFSLLSGPADSQASVDARRCFAHALLDHSLPSPTSNSYSSELDAQIRSYFVSSGGPTLVLIQGPYRVDFILEDPPTPGTPKSMSTVHTTTSTMTAANAGPSNLQDAVFLGYTLHNELVRCNREDKEQYGRLALFLLTTLAHETSHWLYTKAHGYRRDDARHNATGAIMSSGSSIRSSSAASATSFGLGGAQGNVNISQAGQKSEDPLVSFGQMKEDCGARTTDMLLGGTAMMVSWADGDTEILKRKIQPPISAEPPVLSHAAIEALLGCKIPKINDISGQPPLLIGGPPPAWSQHDAYLVTSKTVVNSFCPHGACRIGDLF